MREGSPEKILELAQHNGALQYGDFILSSGARSSFYFDGRLLSLDPEGAYHIVKAFLPLLRECQAQAVGGPTLGADPIVAALVLGSYVEGRPLSGFLVRSERKDHGTGKVIEGPLAAGKRVAIVDDVCTTGASLLRAAAAAEEAGCQVVQVLAILDRGEGGSEAIRRRGYPFVALLEATPEGTVRPYRREEKP